MNSTFNGPLFIIGMPRSGTKLLRDLLLKNDRIGIPLVETGFLPYWYKNWSRYGDLSIYGNFEKFYNSTIKLPYFYYMKHEGERHNGKLISCLDWYNLCLNYSISGVFEALIRHDSRIPVSSASIWGDKSPSYLNHLPLLKEIFPKARFIHIVRDVRDYCLSIEKAWNKNIFRAAQRWQDCIAKASKDAARMEKDYFIIKYEDLIEDPGCWLQKICNFLEIPYDPNMTKLSKSSENLGDTAGVQYIVKSNKQKYLDRLDPVSLRKIEAISKSTLKSLKYPVNDDTVSIRLSRVALTYYQLIDAVNLVRAKSNEMQESGVIGALKFHIRHLIATRFNDS